MSPHRERPAERRVRGLRAPDEGAAEERAWQVVRSVYLERAAVPQPAVAAGRSRSCRSLAVIAGVLALTPAGATVHRWIDQTLGVPHASRALFALPAPGQILVSGPGGVWTSRPTARSDGSGAGGRPAGQHAATTWPWPHAIELSAIDRRGMPRWALARPGDQLPALVLAQRLPSRLPERAVLRVIAGDGTGDRRLANGVAAVAPAWRWGHQYELAYVTRSGTIVVQDADSGAVAWSRRLREAPSCLAGRPTVPG